MLATRRWKISPSWVAGQPGTSSICPTSCYSVRESFEAREQLHLVITSLGSASHGHGDFFNFMQLGKKRGLKVLEKAGWIGDVGYRPYSATGPITEDTEICAVSLLELDDGEKANAVAALRSKYEQYNSMALEQLPLIRVSPEHAANWGTV